MQEVDKREFAEVWGAAWAMYGKSVSPQLLSIAFEALRAYSIEEVRIGLTRHIQSPDTGQFFPKPADVIKHIDGNSGSSRHSAPDLGINLPIALTQYLQNRSEEHTSELQSQR